MTTAESKKVVPFKPARIDVSLGDIWNSQRAFQELSALKKAAHISIDINLFMNRSYLPILKEIDNAHKNLVQQYGVEVKDLKTGQVTGWNVPRFEPLKEGEKEPQLTQVFRDYEDEFRKVLEKKVSIRPIAMTLNKLSTELEKQWAVMTPKQRSENLVDDSVTGITAIFFMPEPEDDDDKPIFADIAPPADEAVVQADDVKAENKAKPLDDVKQEIQVLPEPAADQQDSGQVQS